MSKDGSANRSSRLKGVDREEIGCQNARISPLLAVATHHRPSFSGSPKTCRGQLSSEKQEKLSRTGN